MPAPHPVAPKDFRAFRSAPAPARNGGGDHRCTSKGRLTCDDGSYRISRKCESPPRDPKPIRRLERSLFTDGLGTATQGIGGPATGMQVEEPLGTPERVACRRYRLPSEAWD